MYPITQRSKQIAKEHNLIIKPSNDKTHKIDVYNEKGLITSIGALGYNDYPTYLKMEAEGKKLKGFANSRKKLYRISHKKDLKTKKGGLVTLILWS